jgi:RNA polymerase sigma-70 factor (ECF subfamily)
MPVTQVRLCVTPEVREAFLKLVSAVEAELTGFVRSHVRARDLAENMVQETFLRAWRYYGFDPTRPDARACLFTIAANIIRDWKRTNVHSSVSLGSLSNSVDSLTSLRTDQLPDDPLRIVMAREDSRTLHRALDRLEPEAREVLERFYLREEGTQIAIAESMGISVAAFNSRLNRARKDLKRILGQMEAGPDGR